MNDTQKIAIIEAMAKGDVLEELLYLRDGIDDREEPCSLLDAFEDLFNRCERCGPDDGYPRSWITQTRDIAIAIGMYREVSEEQLARTISTGKKYAWKHKGKKYEYAM